MIGIITLLIALCAQIGLLIYRIMTKNRQTKVKHIIRLSSFSIFTLLLVTGIYWWGFRWMGLFILLVTLAIFSVIYFIKRPKAEKHYSGFSAILSCVGGCVLLAVCILPGIIFPQFKPVSPSGSYASDTISVTLVDESRTESFSQTVEKKKANGSVLVPGCRG